MEHRLCEEVYWSEMKGVSPNLKEGFRIDRRRKEVMEGGQGRKEGNEH
jgi:hypothetical protein